MFNNQNLLYCCLLLWIPDHGDVTTGVRRKGAREGGREEELRLVKSIFTDW